VAQKFEKFRKDQTEKVLQKDAELNT